MTKPTQTIAIIGCGPRGLSALENFVLALSKTNNKTAVKILIFERTNQLGSGYIYRSNQPDTNWLNISNRALTIEKRPKIAINQLHIEAFPSYHDWKGIDEKELKNKVHDVYPKRSEIGDYLRARYQSIATQLTEHDILEVVNAEVKALTKIADGDLTITLSNDKTFAADEVLLTIGHQDTKLSKQLKKWMDYAKDNATVKVFADAYPIKNILTVDFKNETHTVGFRGFGLATIDVIRAITKANGGRFEIVDPETNKMIYKPGNANLTLIPFSLDGLPMASKPLNAKVDALFKPSKALLLAFKSDLSQVSNDANYSNGNAFLIDAMATVAAQQYINLGNKAYAHNYSVKALKAIISSYLKNEHFTHELIVSNKNATEVIIQAFVDMASAKKPISLDFCLGQVWRHCEPTLYKTMSHSALKDDVISKVIALDERMKRYAFAPPIESLQQLLALIYQGTLNLNVLDDPEITLTKKGWLLEKDGQQVTVDTMVNTVLDAPKIVKVTSPLVTNLLQDSLIQPIHSELGVETKPNGLVVSKNKRQTIHLAVLGRLAKGSVVGVDAILECFGPRIKDWADGVVERLQRVK
ncbi:FAD/NAD(P)-binding protein [Lacinutrix chionoecetis]